MLAWTLLRHRDVRGFPQPPKPASGSQGCVHPTRVPGSTLCVARFLCACLVSPPAVCPGGYLFSSQLCPEGARVRSPPLCAPWSRPGRGPWPGFSCPSHWPPGTGWAARVVCAGWLCRPLALGSRACRRFGATVLELLVS